MMVAYKQAQRLRTGEYWPTLAASKDIWSFSSIAHFSEIISSVQKSEREFSNQRFILLR
jgi:hypothetical protein